MSKHRPGRRSRRPPRIESVNGKKLQRPEEYKSRVFKNAMDRLFFLMAAQGFVRWVWSVNMARWHELRAASARRIQSKIRIYQSKLLSGIRAAVREEARRRREEAEAEMKRKADEERHRQEFEAYKRSVGMTCDGVHYFLTKREMRQFAERRRMAFRRAQRILARR